MRILLKGLGPINKKNLYLLLLQIFFCSCVFAEDELKPTQLLQDFIRTESVYTQGRGELQLSWVPSFFKERSAKTAIAPLFAEFGLTDNWQLNIFLNPYIYTQPNHEAGRSGFGDSGFGTKYGVMNINHSHYHAAVAFNVLLPTGNANKDLSDGTQTYEPALLLARDFPSLNNSQLFSQIGFEFVRSLNKKNDPQDIGGIPMEGDPAAHSFFTNVGYFYPVGCARYVLEMNWETNRWNHGGKENIFYITPGVVLELPHHIELAFGSSAGLTSDSDPYDLFFRITYEFDTLAKPFAKLPIHLTHA